MLNKLKKIEKQRQKLVLGVWDFLKEYSALSVAIGVIFAEVAKDLINNLVSGFILPAISLILPITSWDQIIWHWHGRSFAFGSIISSGLTFVLVVLVLYIVVKKLLKKERFEKKIEE